MSIDLKSLFSRVIILQWMAIILLVILLWLIYSGIRTIATIDKSMQSRDNQRQQIINTNKGKASLIGLKVPFFGDYVPININTADVKPSMLDLKVVGILFSIKGEVSQVIIETAGGTQKTYNVGDVLPGGATIKRITQDGVLLGRNGSLESLSLPKGSLKFEPPPKPLDFKE